MLELKTAVITYLLNCNRPEEALEIASRSTSSIEPLIIKQALSKFVRSNSYKGNASNIAKLMKKLQSRCTDKHYDLAGQVLQSICNKSDQNFGFALTKRLLVDYQRHEVKISNNSASAILANLMKNRAVHVEVNSIVQSLICNELFPEVHTEEKEVTKNASEIESLQQQLIELKANGFPTHGMIYLLIFISTNSCYRFLF